MKHLYFLLTIATVNLSLNSYRPAPFYFAPVGVTQDSARERTLNQIDAAVQKQREYLPTYHREELTVLICSEWSVSDFRHATDYEVYQRGRSRSDVEQELLHRYEYYRLPAFIDHIKTFSEYRPHIKNLYADLLAQKSKFPRLEKFLGWTDPNYIHMLNLAEKLCSEILEQEKIEQAAIQQEQQRRRELLVQRELQRRQEEDTRITFAQQQESLDQLSQEWSDFRDFYQEHGMCDDNRCERRESALGAMITDGCIYETRSYTVSPMAEKFVRAMHGDTVQYQVCYGNQLQQVIHQECIDGIDRLATVPETSIVHPYRESMMHFFGAACGYNQAGATDKATIITDFCWSLIDYGKAVAEGAVTGVLGAVQDMFEHPGNTLLCAVAGKYVLTYQVSKVLLNVADIGITYVLDAESGMQKWDDYTALVTQLIDAISKKELSLRDCLKGAAQFAAQWKAQGKLLNGMGKFCKTAKVKALEFAKKNPLATPEQYMATPEGILLRSTQSMPTSGSGLKYEKRSKCFVANEQEIATLIEKTQKALQPTEEVLKIIGKESLNAPESFFKHIFTAELIEKRFPTGKTIRSVSGFHHYIADHLETMKVKVINPKICEKTKLVIADVLCEGHLEPSKTFFPACWNREKVISKIAEALQNPTKAPLIEGSKSVLYGRTSEGIIVKIIADTRSGNYITAYPDALLNSLLSEV